MNVRQKGHNWERKNVRDLKEIGFKYAATSRATSKLLDDCKVDVNFIPLLWQSKATKTKPNYQKLYGECERLINKHYPPEEAKKLLDKPYVVAHKIDLRKKQNATLTFDYEFGMFLLKLYNEELLRRSENFSEPFKKVLKPKPKEHTQE